MRSISRDLNLVHVELDVDRFRRVRHNGAISAANRCTKLRATPNHGFTSSWVFFGKLVTESIYLEERISLLGDMHHRRKTGANHDCIELVDVL